VRFFYLLSLPLVDGVASFWPDDSEPPSFLFTGAFAAPLSLAVPLEVPEDPDEPASEPDWLAGTPAAEPGDPPVVAVFVDCAAAAVAPSASAKAAAILKIFMGFPFFSKRPFGA
jgi:hypothetical protein